MNEFMAGYGSFVQMQPRAAGFFEEMRRGQLDAVHRSGGAFLFNGSQPKVIDDLFITDDASGSWMAMLGMPLVPNRSEAACRRLLHDFMDDPKRVLRSELDGHFVVFAFDGKHERFIAATDVNSFIPTYYAKTDDGVIFSSSELILARSLHKTFDHVGFSQALFFGATWGSNSRHEGIKKLLPSEVMIIGRDGRAQNDYYWQPNEEALWDGGFNSVLDRWMGILQESVLAFQAQSHTRSISSDLTAGEDSRLIVSQIQHLGIRYSLRVSGFPSDKDVKMSSRYAEALGLALTVQTPVTPRKSSIEENALGVAWSNDGYGSWFNSIDRFELCRQHPPMERTSLHFSGVPGGEVFRGAYYTRAGLVRPSRYQRLDHRLLARFKFLIDFEPGLISFEDQEFLDAIRQALDDAIDDVHEFPAGTQVDHLLRSFQVSLMGCSGIPQRQPFYWPLGLKNMTRSIYNVPPSYKSDSKLTRAATEKLFPALARMRTGNDVPTVRRTAMRFPMFVPGYYSTAKKVITGGIRRVARFQQHSKALARSHRIDWHGPTMVTLLNSTPYTGWFKSASHMVTGEKYRADRLDKMLNDARVGRCDHVELLGRIINLELAARFVHNETGAE